jgi:uncharacterized protein (TIGR02147 family)
MDAQLWLTQEYKKRRAKNPAYSLRAFAKFLHLPAGRVSEILSGKRSATPAVAQKIADPLGLSPQQRKSLAPAKSASDYQLLADDEFEIIADWYHFAILNLVDTEGFRSEPSFIAKRLGISPAEARDAINRLVRLGLLALEGKRLVKTGQNFRTTTDIPSGALRNFQRLGLKQAEESLEAHGVEERDITSIMFPADPELLPEAKRLIREFRYKMDKFFEGGRRTEVFRLNVQLVPVTKKEREK